MKPILDLSILKPRTDERNFNPNQNGTAKSVSKETVATIVCTALNEQLGIKTVKVTDSLSELKVDRLDLQQVSGMIEEVLEREHGLSVDVDIPLNFMKDHDKVSDLVALVMTALSSASKAERGYTWDHVAFENDMRQLESYRQYLRSLDGVSTEGLGTGLLKVFIGVTDIFLRVGNTFKTNVFKFYKEFKRSEMRYYFESHTTMCLKAEGVPFPQVAELDVPIPSGMKGVYQIACLTLLQTYTSLDLMSYANGVHAALVDMRRKLTRSEDYKTVLVPLENIMNQRAAGVKSIQNTIDRVFTQTKTPLEVKFKDVYKSMKEFKDVRIALLDQEKYLADAGKMVALVDQIDVVLADITSYLSNDEEVDKAMITSMINIVKFMATCFDIYGANVTRQMAVEHNHIGALCKVWSTVN